MSDLWPPEFGTLDVLPPLVLLKEQADILGARTRGRVLAQVNSGKHASGFLHEFIIVAPFLDNYNYRLFTVTHSLDLYPLELNAEVIQQVYTCKSSEQLAEELKTVFASEKTKRVIAAILAQTDAVVKA